MYGAAPGSTSVDASGPFVALEPALSAAELMSAWLNAGGDRNVAENAAAVALAESAGVPNAVNPIDNYGQQTSWGLWQLSNGDHNAPGRYWATPLENARGAVAKYNRAGGTFARDWGTYGGAAYAQYLAQIQATNYGGNPYDDNSDLGDGAGGGDNAIEKGINAVTGGLYDDAKGALNVAHNLLLLPEHIAQNLGPFIVGIMLLAIGGGLMMFSWGEHLVDALGNGGGGVANAAVNVVTKDPEAIA